MSTRLIQASIRDNQMDEVCKQLDDLDPKNWWRTPGIEGSDRQMLHIITPMGRAQEILDHFRETLEDDDWRVVVLPVNAAAPELLNDEQKEELKEQNTTSAREEIYNQVRGDSAVNVDFLLMVFLSTIVAAIGLNEDEVAVVIGAMVIAPLLGPILAFSLGVALGDLNLLREASLATVFGVAIGMIAPFAIGWIVWVNPDSDLLQTYKDVSLSVVILALASGAAASLSTANGKASALVGVMVAAALLPPAAATGLLAGAGEFVLAMRAFYVVIVNLACIALAAQAVFLIKGIRPHGWLDDETAKTSIRISLGATTVLVAALAAGAFWL